MAVNSASSLRVLAYGQSAPAQLPAEPIARVVLQPGSVAASPTAPAAVVWPHVAGHTTVARVAAATWRDATSPASPSAPTMSPISASDGPSPVLRSEPIAAPSLRRPLEAHSRVVRPSSRAAQATELANAEEQLLEELSATAQVLQRAASPMVSRGSPGASQEFSSGSFASASARLHTRLAESSREPLESRVASVLRECKSRLAESRMAVVGLECQRNMLSRSLQHAEGDFRRMQREWRQISGELASVKRSMTPDGHPRRLAKAGRRSPDRAGGAGGGDRGVRSRGRSASAAYGRRPLLLHTEASSGHRVTATAAAASVGTVTPPPKVPPLDLLTALEREASAAASVPATASSNLGTEELGNSLPKAAPAGYGGSGAEQEDEFDARWDPTWWRKRSSMPAENAALSMALSREHRDSTATEFPSEARLQRHRGSRASVTHSVFLPASGGAAEAARQQREDDDDAEFEAEDTTSARDASSCMDAAATSGPSRLSLTARRSTVHVTRVMFSPERRSVSAIAEVGEEEDAEAAAADRLEEEEEQAGDAAAHRRRHGSSVQITRTIFSPTTAALQPTSPAPVATSPAEQGRRPNFGSSPPRSQSPTRFLDSLTERHCRVLEEQIDKVAGEVPSSDPAKTKVMRGFVSGLRDSALRKGASHHHLPVSPRSPDAAAAANCSSSLDLVGRSGDYGSGSWLSPGTAAAAMGSSLDRDSVDMLSAIEVMCSGHGDAEASIASIASRVAAEVLHKAAGGDPAGGPGGSYAACEYLVSLASTVVMPMRGPSHLGFRGRDSSTSGMQEELARQSVLAAAKCCFLQLSSEVFGKLGEMDSAAAQPYLFAASQRTCAAVEELFEASTEPDQFNATWSAAAAADAGGNELSTAGSLSMYSRGTTLDAYVVGMVNAIDMMFDGSSSSSTGHRSSNTSSLRRADSASKAVGRAIALDALRASTGMARSTQSAAAAAVQLSSGLSQRVSSGNVVARCLPEVVRGALAQLQIRGAGGMPPSAPEVQQALRLCCTVLVASAFEHVSRAGIGLAEERRAVQAAVDALLEEWCRSNGQRFVGLGGDPQQRCSTSTDTAGGAEGSSTLRRQTLHLVRAIGDAARSADAHAAEADMHVRFVAEAVADEILRLNQLGSSANGDSSQTDDRALGTTRSSRMRRAASRMSQRVSEWWHNDGADDDDDDESAGGLVAPCPTLCEPGDYYEELARNVLKELKSSEHGLSSAEELEAQRAAELCLSSLADAIFQPPDAAARGTDDSDDEGAAVVAGRSVQVRSDIHYHDTHNDFVIPTGSHGRVIRKDEHGDARVEFDTTGEVWVLAADLKHLQLLPDCDHEDGFRVEGRHLICDHCGFRQEKKVAPQAQQAAAVPSSSTAFSLSPGPAKVERDPCLAAPPASPPARSTLPASASNGPQPRSYGRSPLQSPPQRIQVTVVSATGLRHLHMAGDCPRCECMVRHADGRDRPASFETGPGSRSLEPVWNETKDLYPWRPGEALDFIISDSALVGSVGGSKPRAKASLPSVYFYPDGFEGDIAIGGMAHARLFVKVMPEEANQPLPQDEPASTRLLPRALSSSFRHAAATSCGAANGGSPPATNGLYR
eukprot:TRINITY_DN44358_c0_g1_i2.p1 TRINITY_DN44358_c0_g1~~TRINITY_DN44358_c0_g1_i2.p1  ORF type:complete len:1594 (-),score=345.29 TRINITY_DN44358_c0_g1_i2:161-4942(-)